MTYRTFKRSCTNWKEFSSAPKEPQETGLSREDAYAACQAFNDTRNEGEIFAGTKLEFESEE